MRTANRWSGRVGPLVYVVFIHATLMLGAAQGASAIARPATLDVAGSLRQMYHESWNTENGLPNDRVVQVLQAPDGYLWLGTESGAVRFDGQQFKVFTQVDAGLAGSGRLIPLGSDNQGGLWFSAWQGMKGSLLRYEVGRFSAIGVKLPRGVALMPVISMLTARDGSLWFGAFGGQLLRRDPQGMFQLMGSETGYTSHSPVMSIVDDGSGGLWCGTAGQGLYRYQGGRFRHYGLSDGLADLTIWSLARDRHGRLWAGTNRGVVRWENDVFSHLPLTSHVPFDQINSLHVDAEDRLWVGTDGRGLFRSRGDTFESLDEASGLSNNVVRSIVSDREGSVWIGTRSGLDRLRVTTFSTLTTRDGLPTNSMGSIATDRDGVLWIAPLAGGLLSYRKGELLDHSALVGNDKVMALARSAGGGMWLGFLGNGIGLLRNGTLRKWGTAQGMLHPEVDAVFEDSRGRLWASVWKNGLAVIEDGRLRSLTAADGISVASPVSNIVEESDRSILVSNGSALVRINQSGIQRIDSQGTLPYINRIHISAKGELWLCGTGAIAVRRQGRLIKLGTAQGVPDGVISDVVLDGAGGAWIAGLVGIYRTTESNLEAVLAGHEPKLNLRRYVRGDGLEGTSLSFPARPSVAQTPDQRVWFSMNRGLAVAHPARLPRNLVQPLVHIEEVRAGNRILPVTDSLNLPPDTERLSFAFTATSLFTPANVRFRYRLQNYDSQWTEVLNQRSVSYTHLPPGSYRFEVLATNGDELWSQSAAGLTLSVSQHYYQSWWFITLSVLSIATASWLLHRLHLRGVRREFAAVLGERTRMAQEIHDTLIQGFAGVTLQLRAATRQLPAEASGTREVLESVLDQARQTLTEARHAVWDMRSPALAEGGLPLVLEQIVSAATSLAPAMEAKVDVQGQVTPIPSRVERALLRVTQEAVSNAVRHGKPRRLTVSLSYEPSRRIHLSVEDDGCGFVPESAIAAYGGHWGLLGMRERIEALKGRLEIKSAPGQGTVVRAEVPV